MEAGRVLVTGRAGATAAAVVEALERSGGAEVLWADVEHYRLGSRPSVIRLLTAAAADTVVHLLSDVDDIEGLSVAPYEEIVAAVEIAERARLCGVHRLLVVTSRANDPAASSVTALLESARGVTETRSEVLSVGAGRAAETVAAVLAALGLEPEATVAGAGTSSPTAADADPASRLQHAAERAAALWPPAVEELRDGDELLAVILRGTFDEPGPRFFSESHFSQQLGHINYPAGHVIVPHVHNAVPREVVYTQETLFVRQGRMRVDLYRPDCTVLLSRVLTEGDTILLATGGHGFVMLDDTAMVEVKQGPYAGDGDKTRFEARS